MEVKQLELFKDTDFEKKHTYIKRNGNWYLFDNIKNRTDFGNRTDNRYMMTCSIKTNNICAQNEAESKVCYIDKEAKVIDMHDYLKLAVFLRCRGNIIYNKKLGKTIPKI